MGRVTPRSAVHTQYFAKRFYRANVILAALWSTPRDGTTLHEAVAKDEPTKQFYKSRQQIRDQADALKLAQAKMAEYYDKKHSKTKPADSVYLKVVRGVDKGYRIPNSTTLDPIKIGPFEVISKVSKLAYKLNLPPHIKVYPVVSVIHLEPAIPNPYVLN